MSGGGGGYERDVDSDNDEGGWSREWDRGGGKTEKEFEGSHGGHWTETTYRNGILIENMMMAQ